MAWTEAYLYAKFYLDQSNRSVSIHRRYRQDRQTGQDRQWSDSIGQTILQTVAQLSIIILKYDYMYQK